MRRRDGMRVHVVVEPGDLAVTHGERHGPFRLDRLARRTDALTLAAEDHDLVAVGEVLLGLEHLEFGCLVERLEEPRDLVASAVRPRERELRRPRDPPLDVVAEPIEDAGDVSPPERLEHLTYDL